VGFFRFLIELVKRGLVPPFLFVYIDFIPGFPGVLTVPADDMQIEHHNLHVRTNHGKYHV
jgi:hypothetical protein